MIFFWLFFIFVVIVINQQTCAADPSLGSLNSGTKEFWWKRKSWSVSVLETLLLKHCDDCVPSYNLMLLVILVSKQSWSSTWFTICFSNKQAVSDRLQNWNRPASHPGYGRISSSWWLVMLETYQIRVVFCVRIIHYFSHLYFHCIWGSSLKNLMNPSLQMKIFDQNSVQNYYHLYCLEEGS